MQPLKATLLDDDAFRLLAIPFGGPIPSPHSPIGVDLDGEWFDKATDVKPHLWAERDVDWHHGHDDTVGRTIIGKSILDDEPEDDGWWATIWLKHGERRLALIKALAERGAQLFGSSQAPRGTVRKASTGYIEVWPYWRQTLSTSPQNTYSVLRPMKADTDDGETRPFHEVLTRDLGADLHLTYQRLSAGGDGEAKARRVLDETNARLARTLAAIRT
jgi:hypothetical protein